MANVVKLLNNLQDPMWRIQHLYTISDKNSRVIPFRPNHGQLKVLTEKHPRKLILKSRQVGISTLYVIYNLDLAIFNPLTNAGIQSYGRDETKKLYKRALFSWEQLDPQIKKLLGIRLTKNSSTEGLEFSNGSVLRIGNFRGDTLQSLHVSELAKISAKYPARAEELKTGAFEAVGQGNHITIETTAEGDAGLFPEMWATAEALQDTIASQQHLPPEKRLSLTPLDFVPIFLPWMNDPDCNIYDRQLDDYDIDNRLKEYFSRLVQEFDVQFQTSRNAQLEALLPADRDRELPALTLTESQLVWLSVKLRALGSNFSREYPATPSMAFEQSVEGTYFKDQYEILLKEHRIQSVQYRPLYPVYTSWDLGVNDENVILFWQVIDNSIYLIDEYHNTSKGLAHYIEVLRARGYMYRQHFLPHDIRVQSLSTGKTRLQTLMELGLDTPIVLDRLPFTDSIDMARKLITAPNFLLSQDAQGTISGIRMYRKDFDQRVQAYKSTDIHDIHSNYMAAFRYGAQGLSRYIRNTIPTPTKAPSTTSTGAIAV